MIKTQQIRNKGKLPQCNRVSVKSLQLTSYLIGSRVNSLSPKETDWILSFSRRLQTKLYAYSRSMSERDLPAMLFRIDVPEYANNPCRKASAICETSGSSASKAFSNLATFSLSPIPNSTIPVKQMKQRTVIFAKVLTV